MRIYNYLFYKSFILYKKSKNFDDIPVLSGMIFPFFCITMNFLTLMLFLEGLGVNIGIDFVKYKFLFSFGSGILLLLYYSYKGRYKKIIKYYEERKDKMINFPAGLVILFYYLTSAFLFFMAGLFYNRMWIFVQ